MPAPDSTDGLVLSLEVYSALLKLFTESGKVDIFYGDPGHAAPPTTKTSQEKLLRMSRHRFFFIRLLKNADGCLLTAVSGIFVYVFRFRINTYRENRSSGRWERTLYVRREELR